MEVFGPGGPLEITVCTVTGIQEFKSLLVFSVASRPFVRSLHRNAGANPAQTSYLVLAANVVCP
jgi:hypothetical protein